MTAQPEKKYNDRNYAYCMTINNYTEEDYQRFKDHKCRYKCYAKEVGESGTPHIQAYIYFENKISFKSMKKKYPTAHFELPRGTPQQNRQYIVGPYQSPDLAKSKPFNPEAVEEGDIPKSVSVNEWEDIKTKIMEGIEWEQLLVLYPQTAIKYLSGLRNYYEQFRPKVIVEIPNPYPYQKFIMDLTKQKPDARTVYWFFEPKGNVGKTTIARYLSSKGWLYLSNGKTADIALAWQGQNVVFDFSRSQNDHINYEVMEMLKNGIIFSSKYQSASKIYNPPHLICFSNKYPNMEKLSQDRWQIYKISQTEMELYNDDEELDE